MKYISIDIETTGLDADIHQILEIAAVVEDTNNIKPLNELPRFVCIINQTNIIGSPYAINMNMRLIEILANYNTLTDTDKINCGISNFILEPHEVMKAMHRFINKNYADEASLDKKISVNVAGKNFSGFDNKFLNKLPDSNKFFTFKHRVIDPGTSYIDWVNDDTPPDLSLCKKRAGLEDITISHHAEDDALDVIACLRPLYTK